MASLDLDDVLLLDASDDDDVSDDASDESFELLPEVLPFDDVLSLVVLLLDELLLSLVLPPDERLP